ncbi:MAG: ldhA [Caulobacter sp.]|nr:ldhA [Caulobacter sp.]
MAVDQKAGAGVERLGQAGGARRRPALERSMNIVIFEAEDGQQAACARLSPPHALRFSPQPLTAATAAAFADAQIVSTFLDSKLDAAALKPLTRLRLIATRSTGFDHIDLDACAAANIGVCNVPDYGDPTVAEHAFALLLALSRRIPLAVERTRRGDFSQGGLRGFDLAGRTLGVIGVGNIGARVIRIARGFGMKVIAFDAEPDLNLQAKLDFTFVDLSQLLAECDVLTLHVPGGEASRGLIGAAELARMKPGAVLINTARGGVVDAEALIEALSDGRLAGAALDVLSEELSLRDEARMLRADIPPGDGVLRALAADHALLRLPNVIVTPHVAYDTGEAVARILDITLANIEAFAAGAPTNLVVRPVPVERPSLHPRR